MKTFNFKKIILVVSIVIVLNLFFNYGIFTFYKAPDYNNYCGAEKINKSSENETECKANGGFWNIAGGPKVPQNFDCTTTTGQPAVCETKPSQGYCDMQYYCQKDYQTQRDLYDRNLFIILVVAGIISIVVGFAFSASEVVSMGLSYGGVLSLIIGSVRYWSAMDDYLRFIILGLALGVLIWLGIKKFGKEEEKPQ